MGALESLFTTRDIATLCHQQSLRFCRRHLHLRRFLSYCRVHRSADGFVVRLTDMRGVALSQSLLDATSLMVEVSEFGKLVLR